MYTDLCRHLCFWSFCSLLASLLLSVIWNSVLGNSFFVNHIFHDHLWMDIPWFYWFFFLVIPSLSYVYIRSRLKLPAEGKAVLITGCDSGFGFTLAKSLYNKGCIVFAGCLDKEKGEGSRALAQIDPERLHVIQLDVTSQEQVKAALKYVESNLPNPKQGLWGLVNNAGTANYGYVEWLTLDQFKSIAEVNLWGTVRVTQAFLPLIRCAKGRVVNMSSQLGLCCVPLRGPYSITKYGVEAFSDTLRLEMRSFGVDVCIIEPGNFTSVTNIWSEEELDKQQKVLSGNMSDELRTTYGAIFKRSTDLMKKFITGKPIDTKPVIDAYECALLDCYPYPRYQPMQPKLKLANWTNTHLPETLYEKLFISKPQQQ